MKIPRKISPDNLKDTIIQVVYTAEPAPELLLGYVEQTLKGIFHFITGIPKDENSKNDKGFLIVNEVEKGFFISKNITADLFAKFLCITKWIIAIFKT